MRLVSFLKASARSSTIENGFVGNVLLSAEAWILRKMSLAEKEMWGRRRRRGRKKIMVLDTG